MNKYCVRKARISRRSFLVLGAVACGAAAVSPTTAALNDNARLQAAFKGRYELALLDEQGSLAVMTSEDRPAVIPLAPVQGLVPGGTLYLVLRIANNSPGARTDCALSLRLPRSEVNPLIYPQLRLSVEQQTGRERHRVLGDPASPRDGVPLQSDTIEIGDLQPLAARRGPGQRRGEIFNGGTASTTMLTLALHLRDDPSLRDLSTIHLTPEFTLRGRSSV
ncbi:twin-arginine translocation signal domain-containing protein [Glutamicibacter endophyticus]